MNWTWTSSKLNWWTMTVNLFIFFCMNGTSSCEVWSCTTLDVKCHLVVLFIFYFLQAWQVHPLREQLNHLDIATQTPGTSSVVVLEVENDMLRKENGLLKRELEKQKQTFSFSQISPTPIKSITTLACQMLPLSSFWKPFSPNLTTTTPTWTYTLTG